MKTRYREELLRHPAVTAEGKPCEILERITWEHPRATAGSPGEASVINRRFDLRTGERVNRLGEAEFEVDGSGLRLHLQR